MVQTMAMSDLLLCVAIIEKNERGQEVELVRKTMQFKPQTTALDACAQIRERLSEIKGLGHPNQYGLFLMDEDPKKGVRLELHCFSHQLHFLSPLIFLDYGDA
jgi:hypothetical protein